MTGTILWGTSTWTYEGWQGLVYADVAGYGKSFARRCLAEYARNPRFRFGCVGVDNTFYAPPSADSLAEYAAQLPPGFPCVVKVWQGLTAPFFTKHFGPAEQAGQPNPRFLDPGAFDRDFLPGFRAAFRDHVGAFVLEIPVVPPHLLSRDAFLERLDAFLGAVEPGWPLSVELRSRWWLSERYFSVLARHGVAHCFAVWSRMPLPHEVLERHPRALATAPFSVCRALVAPGTDYAAAVKRFQPYDRIQARRPDVRRSLLTYLRSARDRVQQILVAVNNRLEGCAPITIEELRAQLEGGGPNDGLDAAGADPGAATGDATGVEPGGDGRAGPA